MYPGSRRSLAMVAAISILILSGCSSPPGSIPGEGSGTPRQAMNHRPLLDYQTIWLQNSAERLDGERIGFLGSGPASDDLDPAMMTNVYDLNWKMIGFIVENGTTFRLNREKKPEKVGNFPLADSVQILFGRSGVVRITPGI